MTHKQKCNGDATGTQKHGDSQLQSFMLIFSYTFFLRSMDWLTTGLSFMVGLSEGNPLQAWLLEMGAVYYFVVQWLGILVMTLLIWTLSRRVGLSGALLFETGILLYPIIHNTVLIVVSSMMGR